LYCIGWSGTADETTGIMLKNYYEGQSLFATKEECEAKIKEIEAQEPCLDDERDI
jgi:hypothetical protein